MKRNIQVTQHYAGNDFRGTTTWSVADFDDMSVVKTETETVRRWDDATREYYESRGYEIVKVEKPSRWVYSVTMTARFHRSYEFTSEMAAKKFARQLSRQPVQN